MAKLLEITLLATTIALVGCSKKEGSTTKTDNGEVTTTTVTDKKGNSLKMEVDNSECTTKEACMKLALSFDSNDKKQVDAMKRACDFGEPAACGLAADAYYDGKVVTKDFASARTLAQKGCDKTVDSSACALLSLIYLNGDGVEADHAKALELGSRACDAAPADETDTLVATACSNAGILLVDAKPVDQAKVGRYMERGCAIDVTQCTNLGVATAKGLFAPKDRPRPARSTRRRATPMSPIRAPRSDAC